MKKILIVSLIFVLGHTAFSQVLFSDNFSTLVLQNDVQIIGSKTITTTYTTIPTGYNLIDDGFKNNVGSNNAPNKPFNVIALKTTGWAILNNSIENDTFLVTTSWLDTTVVTKRFVVTPVINSITLNSILSWEAKSPDINFPEGYEVYVTTNTTGTLTSADFTTSNRVFYLADGNASGGGEKSVWTKRGVSLSAYAGQNVRIAFKNISNNMFQLWLDDIKVENINNAFDAEVSAGQGIYKYNTTNTNGNINCQVTNKGNTSINALTLNYSIKGPVNYNYTQAFGLSQVISPYASLALTFNLPYNIPTVGFYKVKVWVNYVNGNIDQNNVNDTIYSTLSIISNTVSKTVLVEQFVSALDGNSPDGQEKLNALISSSVIAVNIHDNDSLRNSSASGIISAYRKKTTTALVDRTYFNDVSSLNIDRVNYASKINSRKSAVVPVSVSILIKTYNTSTRELTFTVQANFVGEVQGDYRMNAYITENNVSGLNTDTTFNGWNQLSFMYNIPWSPYYQKGYYLASENGYVLKSWEYKHQNVLDTVLDGTFGASGIIPMSGGTLNQSYTKVYTYTVPVAMAGIQKHQPDNLYIVANVSEFNSNLNACNVLNCVQEKVTTNQELVSVNELSKKGQFNFYPNPTFGLTNIVIPEGVYKNSIIISVTDILGKVVYTQTSDMRFGFIQLSLHHLPNGAYFLNVNDGEFSQTKKLIIQK